MAGRVVYRPGTPNTYELYLDNSTQAWNWQQVGIQASNDPSSWSDAECIVEAPGHTDASGPYFIPLAFFDPETNFSFCDTNRGLLSTEAAATEFLLNQLGNGSPFVPFSGNYHLAIPDPLATGARGFAVHWLAGSPPPVPGLAATTPPNAPPRPKPQGLLPDLLRQIQSAVARDARSMARKVSHLSQHEFARKGLSVTAHAPDGGAWVMALSDPRHRRSSAGLIAMKRVVFGQAGTRTAKLSLRSRWRGIFRSASKSRRVIVSVSFVRLKRPEYPGFVTRTVTMNP